jgi:hypothetical protein
MQVLPSKAPEVRTSIANAERPKTTDRANRIMTIA